MGGMQVLQFISNFPNKSRTVIPIATTSNHSAQNIAFNELGRQAITATIIGKTEIITLRVLILVKVWR